MLALAAISGPERLSAQLISPGELSQPHADLSGIRQCTKCHELRHKGPSRTKCLACHTPLADRIDRGEGLHADYGERSCAECHRDHLGTQFLMVGFDSTTFAHDSTGYVLKGAHADVECRDCHDGANITAPDVRAFKGKHDALDRTFLGLEQTCLACHEADDPHQGQFTERACDDCHTERTWDEAPSFDHDSTRYRLRGAHRKVDCTDCHKPRRLHGSEPTPVFTGLRFRKCNDCHRDPHDGAMKAACTKCHSTRGWARLDRSSFERRFDHSTTKFALSGAHAEATCASCHRTRGRRAKGISIRYVRSTVRRSYPKPVVKNCLSCHVDFHQGEFQDVPGGTVCSSCHGDDSWYPTSFGLQRHNRDAKFALEGSHMLVPCAGCHQASGAARASFHIDDQRCEACHADDNPHADQFPGRDCAACHRVESFTGATVDHDASRFPLDGAHRDVPCAACHPVERTGGRAMTRFKPLGIACKDCHA